MLFLSAYFVPTTVSEDFTFTIEGKVHLRGKNHDDDKWDDVISGKEYEYEVTCYQKYQECDSQILIAIPFVKHDIYDVFVQFQKLSDVLLDSTKEIQFYVRSVHVILFSLAMSILNSPYFL